MVGGQLLHNRHGRPDMKSLDLMIDLAVLQGKADLWLCPVAAVRTPDPVAKGIIVPLETSLLREETVKGGRKSIPDAF